MGVTGILQWYDNVFIKGLFLVSHRESYNQFSCDMLKNYSISLYNYIIDVSHTNPLESHRKLCLAGVTNLEIDQNIL
jgi:hypothetical protein